MTSSIIVLARTPTELVVSSDSRRLPGKRIVALDDSCKIIQGEDLFFTATRWIEDPYTGFSVRKLAYEAARSGGTIFERAQRFEQKISSQLPKAMEQVRRDNPLFYGNEYRGNNTIGVIFFGVENNVPVFYSVVVTPIEKGKKPITAVVKHESCPGRDCSPTLTYISLGKNEAIKPFIKTHPDIWKNPLEQAVATLVQAQIDAQPRELGGPVDILRVDQSGAKWVQKKATCADLVVPKVKSNPAPASPKD